MSVNIRTVLICDFCGKRKYYYGSIHDDPLYIFEQDIPDYPRNWFVAGPDMEHSKQTSANIRFGGNFCSLSCLGNAAFKAAQEIDGVKQVEIMDGDNG